MIQFKKYYLAQSFIFVLTFFSYAFLHANRKSFSNVKSTLQQVWTKVEFNASVPKLFPETIWRSHNLFKNENSAQVYLGVLDTVFMACYAVGLFISGYLGDRFDPRYVLGVGMTLSAIVIFLFGFLTEFLHFYNLYFYTFLYGLNGLCQSTGWPATVALMANWFGHSRGFWLCLWSSCAYVGNIVGDLVTGGVLVYGYQYGFLVPAAMLFSGGFIIMASTVTTPGHLNGHGVNYEVLQQVDDSIVDEVYVSIDKVPTKLSFLRIIMIPGVIGYSLAYACLKMVNYAFFFWLPVYLFTFGWSNAKSDQVSMWYDVGSIVGGVITGLLSDLMWSRSPVTVLSLVLTVVALVVYRDIPGVEWKNALFLSLIGVFIGGPANLISSTISADLGTMPLLSGNKAALASVTGIVDGTGSIGASIGQVCVPLIQQYYSWRSVFIFFMAMITLSVLCLLPILIKDILRLIRNKRIKKKLINDASLTSSNS